MLKWMDGMGRMRGGPPPNADPIVWALKCVLRASLRASGETGKLTSAVDLTNASRIISDRLGISDEEWEAMENELLEEVEAGPEAN
ncbi:MAG TPA: hypothetical protein VMM79_14295 [Longimicrobiales bacterium]|nr:hypothetical protein [Longimicrobiales bacterium]